MPPRSFISYNKSVDYDADFEAAILMSQFQQSSSGDLFRFNLSGATEGALVDVVKDAASRMTLVLGLRPRIRCFADGGILLEVGQRFILSIAGNDGPDDMWEAGYQEFSLIGFGEEADVTALRSSMMDFLRAIDVRAPTIRWQYSTGGSRSFATMPLEKPKPVFDAFYPWIKGGTAAYFEQFAASDDVVLMLLGDPGTGKTSFVRHLRWNCTVTYDEQLLRKDDLFVSFITNDHDDVMIVEDADMFLTTGSATITT